jgi:hypothetical protein
MLRILVALMGLTLLSACNVLVTDKPLFSAADEAGAPALKPGVWLLFEGPGCKLDPRTPIDEWPDCAGGGMVRGGEVIDHDEKAPKGVWEHSPFIFAAGDPRIAQLQVKGQITTNAGSQTTLSYGYAGARPTKLDDQGRIVALSYWFVICGPPPPKDKNGNDSALGTLKPFPGLTMKPHDATCTTDSQAVVRSAAIASEAFKDGPAEARWLRDGSR